ncbi:alpha/beta hydrolase [Geobacter sp.]|uniref:alpha/beta hydrolase n=1 Tax=Geobacter sp. TaxID=46610 RepID=UPI00262B9998|nr:alpha/beta hydrolase [Geobacter sp.]
MNGVTGVEGILLSLLKAIALAYGVSAVCAALFAERFIFQPPAPSYRTLPGAVRLVAGDGVPLSAVYLPNPSARFTILYSHGNGEDLGNALPFLQELREHGYAVFSYDYRGYGTSGGRPTEAGTYSDIEAAYAYLRGTLGIPSDRIVIHGYSVGCGPSIDLAVRRPVGGLIVESGFTSAFRAVTRIPLLPFDRYPNIGKMGRLTAPLLVIHGTLDRIIPLSHGRRLYDSAPGPKRFVPIAGGGHWDLRAVAGERYWEALRDFTALLAERPGL